MFEKRITSLTLGVVTILLIILPFIQGDYWNRVLILWLINSISALGLGILLGRCGQLAICQAAFCGVGAYTSAILCTQYNFPALLSVILGASFASLIGIIIGIPSLRLRGHYLAISTLALGILLYQVFLNWISLTNGPMGLVGIPAIAPRKTFYFLVLITLSILVIFVSFLYKTRLGLCLEAVKNDELMASALGMNPIFFKLLAFALCAFLGGLSGALFAHFEGIITPGQLSFLESVGFILMVVLGGMNKVSGPLVGAFIITILPEALRATDELRLLFLGAVTVVIMISFPQGIAGGIESIFSGKRTHA